MPSVKDFEKVGTMDARVTRTSYTEYTPVTNNWVEALIFPDVPTLRSGLKDLEWGQGNFVSIKIKQKRSGLQNLEWGQENFVSIKSKQKRKYPSTTMVVLMFYLDTGEKLGRVPKKVLFYMVHLVMVTIETVDMEGNKEMFYMDNMEVVDEVYYCNGMVLDNTVQLYNLAWKEKEINYEVSEAKEDYRIRKVIYNSVILMFVFYEEHEVEEENVKMLYKGPVEDKVEMLEDGVVNMVSPVLWEMISQEIRRVLSLFISRSLKIHKKRRGAVPPHSGLGYLQAQMGGRLCRTVIGQA